MTGDSIAICTYSNKNKDSINRNRRFRDQRQNAANCTINVKQEHRRNDSMLCTTADIYRATSTGNRDG